MKNAVPSASRSTEAASPAASSHLEIFELARTREASLARLLIAYVTSGLIFMLLPGTFLGVWNLIKISGRESVASISPAWLQAHGHAQAFGWVGSFILGIGFYSVPKLRGSAGGVFAVAWACWTLWTAGVALRWVANIEGWHWRLLLPVSGALELAAFALFFVVVSRHRPQAGGKVGLDPWIWVVISATVGLGLLLVANLAGCLGVALHGAGPEFAHVFDQRYLALMAWGFLVPFVWGFSAKWMPVFLGLAPMRPRWLVGAVAANFVGVVLTFAGFGGDGTWLFAAGTVLAIAALRMFEPGQREPKRRGVHSSFPFFVRAAYGWLLVAALLGIVAARWDASGGIWGACRHALTVGFVSVMVLSVGPRVLPAFAAMRLLWSTRLMFVALALLTTGCTLRVSCEVLAYQGYAAWAWSVLPVSALLELAGLTAFAVNIFGTFLFEPSHVEKQPVMVRMSASSLDRR
ncbi:MAG TPA: hypothetical protein VMH85_12730 [Terriglobales bacterium]|nr:hypothetical protein [Terriglobales bacterium]